MKRGLNEVGHVGVPRPRKATLAMTVVFLLTFWRAAAFQPSISASHNNNPERCLRTVSPPQRRKTPIWKRQQRHWASAIATSDAVRSRQAMEDWGKKLIPVQDKTSQKTRRRQRKQPENVLTSQEDFRRRKDEWASRYTQVDSLRETFGSNRNKLWGDLDPTTARRLYKSLLPKALLELVKANEVQPEDLAPLAYKARLAAKLYARERCKVPARLAANLFDGYRQWRRYGKFQPSGMSYDQVWEKYHERILNEALETEDVDIDGLDLSEEEVKARICLKILEGSCSTNEQVDRWVLPVEEEEQPEALARIREKLDDDVRKLLVPLAAAATNTTPEKLLGQTNSRDEDGNVKKHLTLQQYRVLRLVARAKRRAKNYRPTSQQAHDEKEDDGNELLASLFTQDAKPWNDRESKTQGRTKKWIDREPPTRELNC